eukprot:CAMPEP_0196671734 /NCGR_PEP_ID=MMETSP1090-20130531/1993_1 /TAXON_ID=37098 /ORGANISM="Isochrysis sp, Strain CCMP1244" /LENGTH=240 /DNA_ID=CAMNT_0042009411 /DNA_START=35 /DNA_END=758 /DNA_ORIENTATION=+
MKRTGARSIALAVLALGLSLGHGFGAGLREDEVPKVSMPVVQLELRVDADWASFTPEKQHAVVEDVAQAAGVDAGNVVITEVKRVGALEATPHGRRADAEAVVEDVAQAAGVDVENVVVTEVDGVGALEASPRPSIILVLAIVCDLVVQCAQETSPDWGTGTWWKLLGGNDDETTRAFAESNAFDIEAHTSQLSACNVQAVASQTRLDLAPKLEKVKMELNLVFGAMALAFFALFYGAAF